MSQTRAMLFVDAQNLEQTAKHHYDEEHPVDYVALVDVLTADYDLIRPYYFDSHEPDDDKHEFYEFLRRNLGFRVVSKPLKSTDRHREEKGVDVALATELIAQGFNDSYDVAIVVSGDADYDHAIRYVQDRGKIVEAAAFEGAAAGRLKDVVDDFHTLNEYDDRLHRTE